MVCQKCKAQLPDNTLICPDCSNEVAVGYQQNKCNEYLTAIKGILSNKFHSPLYCMMLIVLTIITALLTSASVTGVLKALSPEKIVISDFFTPAITAIFVLCLLSSVIRGWVLFLSTKHLNPKKIKKLTAIYNCIYVCGIIFYVLSVIAALFILAASVLLFINMGNQEGFTETINNFIAAKLDSASLNELNIFFAKWQINGIQVPITLLIEGLLCIVVPIAITNAFKNARRYCRKLSDCALNGAYDVAKKLPIKRLYFWGAVLALFVIAEIVLIKLYPAPFQFPIILKSVAILGEYIYHLPIILLTGIYMFMLALFFAGIHKNEIKNSAALTDARAHLQALIDSTNSERRRTAREAEENKARIAKETKAREDAEQRRKLSAELEAARLSQDEQQRVMQQMMQQAMMNIQIKAVEEVAQAEAAKIIKAPAVEAPVEEAPVEEAPVEEAPVEEAPVEEAPVEEAPVEEAPVEEAPVEEAPIEETNE